MLEQKRCCFFSVFRVRAMNKILLHAILLLLVAVSPATGHEIALVRGDAGLPAQQAGRAFVRELERLLPPLGAKSIAPHVFHEIDLGADESPEQGAAQISAVRPELILALGPRALAAARLVADVPVVALLVAAPEKLLTGRDDMAAIKLAIPPKAQLDEMSRLLPGIRRVGVIYDPARSAALLAEARAGRPDLEFVALAAADEKAVAGLLDELRSRIDLLWLLPDPTVITSRTFPLFQRFSFENRLPILSFAEKHLKPGAALVVTFDIEAMGREAAALAVRLLRGRPPAERVSVPAGMKTLVNETILQNLSSVSSPS
ncbi:MAG: ABC transporter substrate-binding protein [Thermodesulfobacteriota bacterium]